MLTYSHTLRVVATPTRTTTPVSDDAGMHSMPEELEDTTFLVVDLKKSCVCTFRLQRGVQRAS